MDRVELIFKGINHFIPDEFDRPDKIDNDALRLLDKMRHMEGGRNGLIITINADYATSGHTDKSRHAFGDAFDIVFRDRATRRPLPLKAQFAMASRYAWGGIGVYPFWDDPGVHVDRRPWAVFSRRALWFRDEEKKYHPIEKYFIGEES